MPKGIKYTPEFKREAVKIAQSSDKSLPVIASELGMNYKTLSNWVRASMDKPSKKNKNSHHYQEIIAENAKLKRELKRAQQERNILKKAAACVPQAQSTIAGCVLYCKSYRKDGGRPTDIGCQEQVSNHHKLLLLRAMVVSVVEKADMICQV